jgi:hypothetical protein
MRRRLIRLGATAAVLAVANALWAGGSAGALLSALVTAVALVEIRSGLAVRSRWRAMLSMAWVYWGLFSVSNLIEALVFRVIPLRAAEKAAFFELCVALLMAAVLEGLSRQTEEPIRQETVLRGGLVWRLPMLALLFFVLYLMAGIAIQPWIMSFYAHRTLPSLQQLLVVQFCRGLFDLSCVYPWYRQWAGGRGKAAWVSAYGFAALCGWGPLLLPNQYLPGPIRAAHAVEMGAGGIAFGLLTVYVLLKPKRVEASAVLAQEAQLL